MKAKVLKDMFIISDDNSPIRYEIHKDDIVDVNINIKADAKDVLNEPEGMCYLCKYNGEYKYRYIPVQYLDIDYSEKDIDWEQRRYELAKDVLAGLEVNSESKIESDCKLAIELADEMIKQLKKL